METPDREPPFEDWGRSEEFSYGGFGPVGAVALALSWAAVAITAGVLIGVLLGALK